MLSLRNSAAVKRALSSDIDAELRALIAKRVEQLELYGVADLGELVHFLVVEPGDTVEAVEAELGFPVLTNFVDGARFGEPDFTPSWEVVEWHGEWFEVVFVLSDDGFGWVLLIAEHGAPSLVRACAESVGPSLPPP